MDSKQKALFISALRKASYRWKPRQEAKLAARIDAKDPAMPRLKYKYKCAMCEQYFVDSQVVMDHIEPVVPVEGFKNGMPFDANEYIERMLCPKENFNCLCASCHDLKTRIENEARYENKQKNKVDKPKKKRDNKKKGDFPCEF